MLACLVLASGRVIRHTMLVGPEGRWRDELWLDDRVAASPESESRSSEEPPRLTAPLPINTCGRDSLILLPGVGPVLAGRIEDFRRQQGLFMTAGDLQKVKGIGPALAARLESLVVFLPVQGVPAGSNIQNGQFSSSADSAETQR